MVDEDNNEKRWFKTGKQCIEYASEKKDFQITKVKFGR